VLFVDAGQADSSSFQCVLFHCKRYSKEFLR
jgi:hypothetical protein